VSFVPRGPAPPILTFNGPVHDSSFCIYDSAATVHAEMERISRIKYDTQNPLTGFCALYPERVGDFWIVAIEEGHYLAPLVITTRRTGRAPSFLLNEGVRHPRIWNSFDLLVG
jgi:hypothetical protein